MKCYYNKKTKWGQADLQMIDVAYIRLKENTS